MRLECCILAGWLIASGCSETEIRSEPTEVTDSSGVRIVMNQHVDVPHWDMTGEPMLDLGSMDGGPTEFFQVAGATRLSDGRIAVLNAGTKEVRFFGEDGTYLSSFGGAGEGPREFRFPGPLFRLPDDSLAVWDGGPGQLSVFTSEGTYVRSVAPATLNPMPLALLPDGRLILTSDQFDFSSGPGFQTMYTEFWLIGADGELISQLSSQPLGEFGRFGETGMVGTPLFGTRTRSAGDSHGYWVGTGVFPEIRKYSVDGDLELIVRWEEADRSVTEDDAAQALAEELAGASEQESVRIRQLHAARPVAERFPAHEELQLDELGSLWVQEYERPGYQGPSRWKVFSDEGVLQATASLPAEHRVFEIGGEYVLAVGMDELGIEHVRLFELDRSP